jgi:ABC-2 type transport system ATP-binding protein
MEVGHKMVRNYSGGMIRRLEIAQSMLHRPPVLFLDEPTVGLDPLARRAVWDHLGRLRADFGTTIFLTTHYMDEAESLCTRVAIMHLGEVVAVGPVAELKAAIGGKRTTLEDVFAHYTQPKVVFGSRTGFRRCSLVPINCFNSSLYWPIVLKKFSMASLNNLNSG